MAKNIRVEVAYALPHQQTLLALDVPENSTVLETIQQSGILETYPEIDLTQQKVGILSRIVSLDTKLQHKDRIEIYRPLIIDPKEIRRLRAKKQQES